MVRRQHGRDIVTHVDFFDMHDPSEKVRTGRLEEIQTMGVGKPHYKVILGFKSAEEAQEWLMEQGAENITDRLYSRDQSQSR